MTEFCTANLEKLIELPACAGCGGLMLLTRIDPDHPDHEKRTFECTACKREQSAVVKYR